MNKLIELLNYEGGFFIEAGANDGVEGSYTRHLDNKGWSGMLIEPNKTKLDEAARNRPNLIFENYALVSSSFDKSLIKGTFGSSDRHSSLLGMTVEDDYLFEDEELSYWRKLRENSCIEVPAITLSKLLEKHGKTEIDFFSLDVEGYELNVLDGLDLSRNRPKVLLIEVWEGHEREAVVTNYMSRFDYKVSAMIKNNRLFLDGKIFK